MLKIFTEIWKAEREGERERAPTTSSRKLLPQVSAMVLSGSRGQNQKPRTQSRYPTGELGSNYLNRHYCFPRSELPGSWSQGLDLGIKAQTLQCEIDELTIRPIVCPMEESLCVGLWGEECLGSKVTKS